LRWTLGQRSRLQGGVAGHDIDLPISTHPSQPL
jgi:hypothetical protein